MTDHTRAKSKNLPRMHTLLYAPGSVTRGTADGKEVVNHDADRLLAKKHVQVEAPLPGHADHRPFLKVHHVAAPRRGGGGGGDRYLGL